MLRAAAAAVLLAKLTCLICSKIEIDPCTCWQNLSVEEDHLGNSCRERCVSQAMILRDGDSTKSILSSTGQHSMGYLI